MFILSAPATTLPNGYTELEYIKSVGEYKWIDTGYVPSAEKTRIVSKVDFLGEHLDNKLFNAGAWLQDLYQVARLDNASEHDNKIRIYYYTNGNPTYDTTSSFTEQSNPVFIDFNKTVLNINGNTVHIFSNKNQTSSTTLRIFYNTGIGQNDINLYYFKIYDNDTLVRNFIPAKHGDEIGLYDLVENKFYTNAGSGTFIAGPVVNTCTYTTMLGTQVCLSESQPTGSYLVVRQNGNKYYLNLSVENDALNPKAITSESNNVLRIKVGNTTYNAHDTSVNETTL